MAAALLLACGPPKGVASGAPAAVPEAPVPAPRPLSQVFVLEAAGAQPDDTVLTVKAGHPRVVVLRRSAPDFGLFAELLLPADSVRAAGATSDLRIALRPSPGTYGLDLELDTAGAPRSTLVFSYGAHFVARAPATAATWPSNGRSASGW
ncbi:MAG: hypothetical protein HOP28_17765 [Gemmatimonadales bacterium]|nr:hypothetical protein [Gemmatimonadales bacterium]